MARKLPEPRRSPTPSRAHAADDPTLQAWQTSQPPAARDEPERPPLPGAAARPRPRRSRGHRPGRGRSSPRPRSLDRMLGHEAGELVGVDGLVTDPPRRRRARRPAPRRVRERRQRRPGRPHPAPALRRELRARRARRAGLRPDQRRGRRHRPDVRDITQRREAEEALRDVRILHEAVASVAARFVDADPDSVDDSINHALVAARRSRRRRPRVRVHASPKTSR